MSEMGRRQFLAGSGAALVPGIGLAVPAGAQGSRTGAVATPDTLSAEVGMAVLRRGGNAVDAAIAIALALAVTYPEAGNIGGGGFMTGLVRGRPWFLDYRESAPRAATETMYQAADGSVMDGWSLVGNLAAGVPGTVRGLWDAHRRFGTRPWGELVEPAIALARDGFDPPAQMVRIRDDAQRDLGGANRLGGRFNAMAAGQVFRQPELADTLTRIARQGPDGFYAGETADLIVAQMARGMPRGIITAADLAAYRARWRRPIEGRWRGLGVITAPPPSSGGIALMQLLTMKALRDDLFAGVPHNSSRYIHLMAELCKRVFADRAQYLGDPDYWQVPVARLLDRAYLARRAGGIDPLRPSPTPSIRPGLERPQTTHFSVVDGAGNAVSNTYTINGWYGSGVVVEGAGFLLNNEMDDFSSAPGVPNQFGVVGGAANAIAPGKRPLSSMTPTILTRDGAPWLVLGSPGGSRIITTVFQVIANVVDHQMDLASAVAAQRFHHQLLPEDTIFTEPFGSGADPRVEAELTAMGYRLQMQDYVGDVAAIGRDVSGSPIVAPDPRARGAGRIATVDAR
ncbi:MAG: gamma-glutamyltransferase [Hyphomonadaceae bacterium]|nr:gamma-glutamyltransferase [Hyphomonadaceae bacterium]